MRSMHRTVHCKFTYTMRYLVLMSDCNTDKEKSAIANKYSEIIIYSFECNVPPTILSSCNDGMNIKRVKSMCNNDLSLKMVLQREWFELKMTADQS